MVYRPGLKDKGPTTDPNQWWIKTAPGAGIDQLTESVTDFIKAQGKEKEFRVLGSYGDRLVVQCDEDFAKAIKQNVPGVAGYDPMGVVTIASPSPRRPGGMNGPR